MEKFRVKKEDTVLLIIDLQEKLMVAMKDREKAYKNTNILLQAAEGLHYPVVVTEQYPRGLGETVPEIKKHFKEPYLVEKMKFSACVTELKAILEKLNRKTILVTGSETHVCVYQTVRDLLGDGFKVHVIRDAVCSRFDENYENGLLLMQEMGAVINNTETVLFDMLEAAGTPEFKLVSKLVK